MEHSSRYIVLFAAAVCGVCSIFVSLSEFWLMDRHERNKTLDVQEKVLVLAGLTQAGALSDDAIEATFGERIVPRVIETATGVYADEIDATGFDPQEAMADPASSVDAPENAAKVRRLSNHSVVYHVMGDGGDIEQVILPIQGQGLWGTLYGFLSLGPDANTIQGITFYQHKETPGLGGEVDNPRWKALWKGRKAFDDSGSVAITVKKGMAGTPEQDPYRVDGLSGATITSRGVTNTLAFWLGSDAFGSYLERFRAEGNI